MRVNRVFGKIKWDPLVNEYPKPVSDAMRATKSMFVPGKY